MNKPFSPRHYQLPPPHQLPIPKHAIKIQARRHPRKLYPELPAARPQRLLQHRLPQGVVQYHPPGPPQRFLKHHLEVAGRRVRKDISFGAGVKPGLFSCDDRLAGWRRIFPLHQGPEAVVGEVGKGAEMVKWQLNGMLFKIAGQPRLVRVVDDVQDVDGGKGIDIDLAIGSELGIEKFCWKWRLITIVFGNRNPGRTDIFGF